MLFGLIFGASTVYLGLRAGLTVSASIPIAVLAISVLKKLGGSTILENNIVQTIGSAGESVAGGVVFTIPALIFLAPYGPGVLQLFPDPDAGVRRRHHGRPDDGAAAAGAHRQGARRAALSGRGRVRGRADRRERGGALAKTVFSGLGVGAVWKSLSWIVQIFRTDVGHSMSRTSFFPNATMNVDISPEYMGVGYVIGPRIAGVMFAGGVLSWLVLLPLFSIMGNYMTVPFPPVPASGLRIDQMSAGQLWSAYIRYTGAGAVLASGLITLARTIPTIVSSFRDSVKDFNAGPAGAKQIRTERDLPMIGGARRIAGAGHLPRRGAEDADAGELPRPRSLIVIFGFFFVTVSSRITGSHRVLVQPDLRHDHRHADPDLHDLRRARLDG